MKPRLQVSVSGGRTSAYMAWWCKTNLSHQYEIIFTMANTTWEHPDTLRFAQDVDKHFGLNLVLLEGVIHHDERKSTTHKVVSWDEARQNAELFYEACAKYGLPNQTFKWCTRELKQNVMKSYLRSIGWDDYTTAIGIRNDETRRVSPTADAQNIIYPLVDLHPVDKLDVLMWFEQFPWDLRIAEHEGNCKLCYKKSDLKLRRLWVEHPEWWRVPLELDAAFKHTGPNNVPGPRQMYRGRMSAGDKIMSFVEIGTSLPPVSQDEGGCSESCEVYDTVG